MWGDSLSHSLPCFICASPSFGSLLCCLICRLPRCLKILIALSSGRGWWRSASCRRFGWWGILRSDIGPRISSRVPSCSVGVARSRAVRIILCTFMSICKDFMCRLNLLKSSSDLAFTSRVAVWVVQERYQARLARCQKATSNRQYT